MTRGTLKKPASSAASGALASASSRSSDGQDLVGAIGGVPGDDRCGRRDAGGVDLLHLLGVGEDVAELPGEQINFRGVELEVRERGDGRDLVPCESRRHAKC